MVGGVSIGAFMGALWCMEKDIREVSRKARAWSFVCKLLFFHARNIIISIFFLSDLENDPALAAGIFGDSKIVWKIISN